MKSKRASFSVRPLTNKSAFYILTVRQFCISKCITKVNRGLLTYPQTNWYVGRKKLAPNSSNNIVLVGPIVNNSFKKTRSKCFSHKHGCVLQQHVPTNHLQKIDKIGSIRFIYFFPFIPSFVPISYQELTQTTLRNRNRSTRNTDVTRIEGHQQEARNKRDANQPHVPNIPGLPYLLGPYEKYPTYNICYCRSQQTHITYINLQISIFTLIP